MKHQERVEIAEKLCANICKKYGKRVFLFGILGSTARNEDTDYSDLEMLCVVKGMKKEKDVQTYYKNRYIPVWMDSLVNLTREINKPSFDWPFFVGSFFNINVIYGDEAVLAKLQKTVKKVPEKKMHQLIEHYLPRLFEDIGKIKSIKLRECELRGLNSAVYSFLLHSATILALMNRQPLYGSGYKFFDSVLELKKVPNAFKKKATKLLNSDKLDDIVKISEVLCCDIVNFFEKEGIKLVRVKSLNEVKF